MTDHFRKGRAFLLGDACGQGGKEIGTMLAIRHSDDVFTKVSRASAPDHHTAMVTGYFGIGLIITHGKGYYRAL